MSDVMLNVNKYSSFFDVTMRRGGGINIKDTYLNPASDDEYYKFSALGGYDDEIDTSLEFTLLTYYSRPVLNIRPVQADSILPANNPALADKKLGAAVFQEMQTLRFLGNTAAVGRHEGILKFITDRGNVTRAEVEAYYRSGIRELISQVVDEEFGRVSFLLNNATTNSIRGHNSALTRNLQNGQYILSYGGAYTNNETRVITANSLDALSSEMRNGKYKDDFDVTGIRAMEAQAALIPAVKLSAQAIDGIKGILTSFYVAPNTGTYSAVRDVHVLFDNLSIKNGGQPLFKAITDSYLHVLYGFAEAIGEKVIVDSRGQNVARSLTQEQQQQLVQLR